MTTTLFSGGLTSLAPSRFELSETLDLDAISARQFPLEKGSPLKLRSIKEMANENITYVFNLLRNTFSQFNLNLYILDKLYVVHSRELHEFSVKIDEDLKNIMKKYKDPRKRFNKILEYFENYRKEDNKFIEEELRVINDLIIETNIPPILLSDMKMFIKIEVALDEVLWKITRDKLTAEFKLSFSKVYQRGRKKAVKETMFRLIEEKYKYDELKNLMRKERESRLSFIALIYTLCVHNMKDEKDYFNVGIKYVSWPNKENYKKATEYIGSIFRDYLYEMTRQAAEYLGKAVITDTNIINKEIWKNTTTSVTI